MGIHFTFVTRCVRKISPIVPMLMLLVGANNASAVSFEARPARAVFMFFGGFGSCPVAGSTNELKGRKFMDDLTTGIATSLNIKVETIKTCYAIGASDLYVTNSTLGFENTPTTREDFYTAFAESELSQLPVYVYGQSYGGWTAVDFIHNVGKLAVRGLYTVDPISVNDCTPDVYLASLVMGPAPECTRAPQDQFNVFAGIRQRVGHWFNFFQNEFTHLHSSPIQIANRNLFEDYPPSEAWSRSGGHGKTETDPRIWNEIRAAALADLQR